MRVQRIYFGRGNFSYGLKTRYANIFYFAMIAIWPASLTPTTSRPSVNKRFAKRDSTARLRIVRTTTLTPLVPVAQIHGHSRRITPVNRILCGIRIEIQVVFRSDGVGL